MPDILYMALRYLAYHKIKTGILVISITLILFLPVGLNVLVHQSSKALTARAAATPLIIGAKGSPLELVLNSLYFESDTPAAVRYAEASRLTDTGLALAIPLHTRFNSRGFPVVGTTLEYLDFRNLHLAQGRPMAMLGECVLGFKVAAALGVGVDGHVVSSPESVFDLAGVYPLKMRITGILAPSESPDDRAVFVDLKTTWVIQGLAHGHQDLSQPEAAAAVLSKTNNVVVANASIVQYNEITPANADSFHFHGDRSEFPVTAILAVPKDDKSGTLLQGRYLGQDERVQIVHPSRVMDKLLATILTVQRYVMAAVVLIGVSTLATTVLVFMLSLRLRKRERETMHKIGGSKKRVFAILFSEIAVVLLTSLILAAGLTLLTARYGSSVMQAFIQ